MKNSIKWNLSLVLIFIFISSLMSVSATLKSIAKSAEHVTLTVEVFDRGKPGQAPLDNNYWTKYINEKFGKPNNITVKFIPVPRSQEIDKLNILMASNLAPDICFTYDQNVINNYTRQGGITDLTKLISQYAPDLKKYLRDILSYGIVNGKQMAIPAKRTILANNGEYIRQDWLDKLGLPVPKTREEFYNTMIAFRDKNPGNVKGVVPFVSVGGDYMFSGFLASFWTKMTDEQFATLSDWRKPGQKDGVKFLNKMYNEKLISPNFVMDKTGQQGYADMSNGKGGFLNINFDFPLRSNPDIYNNLKKNVKGAVLTPIDTFQNYAGKYLKNEYNPNGIFVIVPSASKHCVEAVKYLNWLVKPETIFFLQNGEEGVNHRMVDGIPQIISVTSGEKQMNSPYNGDYCILVNGIELNDPDKNIKAISRSYPGFEAEASKAIKIAQTDTYRNFWFTSPNISASKYSMVLLNKTQEMFAKLITCPPVDFDKLYDSQLNEYMKAGGAAVEAEAKKLYYAQTYLKNKNKK